MASTLLVQKFEETSMCIDIEKLKLPEPIYFYDENVLFEDELADNGTATLIVKVVSLRILNCS
jgi:type 2A phosphatase activator TIP41